MKKLSIVLCMSLIIILTSATFLSAEEDTDLYDQRRGISDNLYLSFGVYLPSIDTNVRVDSEQYGTGTDINFENDINMDDSLLLFRFDGHWRLWRYFKIEFGYYDLSRDAISVLKKRIQFGDEIYDISTDVNAVFNTTIYKAAFSISFINDGLTELGISLGANIIDLYVSLQSIANDIKEEESGIAPVPSIGGYAYLTLMPGLFVKGKIDFFTITIEDIEGSLFNLRAAVEYYPMRNLGVGLSYNLFNMEIEAADIEDLSGKFKYSFNGFNLFGILTL